MDLMRIEAPDFDLAMTLNSGQVFHWEKYGAGFCGTIGEHAVYVEKRGEVLQIKMEGGALRRHGQHQVLQNVPRPTTAATAGSRELAPPSAARVVAHYFALDHPLEEICASFPRDQAMNAARDFCRGRRIIRQPKWECLATFICSSMKRVKHIRQISRALRKRCGDARKIENEAGRNRATWTGKPARVDEPRGESIKRVVYPFPRPQQLAQSSEEELRECAHGYRARNLLATARLVGSGAADPDAWSAP